MVHGIMENRTSPPFCQFLELHRMIKKGRRRPPYCDVRGESLGSSQEERVRKQPPSIFFIKTKMKGYKTHHIRCQLDINLASSLPVT